MAEGAVHAQVGDVSEVRERYRLVRPFVTEHNRSAEPGRDYENQNKDYAGRHAESQHAESAQLQHLALVGLLDLKIAWNQLL